MRSLFCWTYSKPYRTLKWLNSFHQTLKHLLISKLLAYEVRGGASLTLWRDWRPNLTREHSQSSSASISSNIHGVVFTTYALESSSFLNNVGFFLLFHLAFSLRSRTFPHGTKWGYNLSSGNFSYGETAAYGTWHFRVRILMVFPQQNKSHCHCLSEK